ncbi:MAG: hypothetical protein ABSG43_21260, partial [Solirubrobacteraceae bacterium]
MRSARRRHLAFGARAVGGAGSGQHLAVVLEVGQRVAAEPAAAEEKADQGQGEAARCALRPAHRFQPAA